MDTKEDFAAHPTGTAERPASLPQYASVAAIHHFHTKEVFLLADYFIPRSAHFFLFTFGQSKDFGSSNAIRFTEYRHGVPVREETLVKNQWKSFFPRYIQLVFWSTVFALRFLPRKCWVITPHPPVCAFERALRILKKQRFVLIIADIFDYDSANVIGRLFNRFVMSCAQSINHLLYLSPAIEERYEALAAGKRKPAVHKRWSLGITKLFSKQSQAEKASQLQKLNHLSIGYIGVVRSCVGLEKLIEYMKTDNSIRLDIVGEGNYTANLQELCKIAGVTQRVVFHGFLSNDKLQELAKSWFCGAMLYDTDLGLYTRYTEPGKAKHYLSLGVPILMTDVSYIVDEIRQYHAGVVVPANTPQAIAEAITAMRADYGNYVQGVIAMADAYDYERKYDGDFAFMKEAAACVRS